MFDDENRIGKKPGDLDASATFSTPVDGQIGLLSDTSDHKMRRGITVELGESIDGVSFGEASDGMGGTVFDGAGYGVAGDGSVLNFRQKR